MDNCSQQQHLVTPQHMVIPIPAECSARGRGHTACCSVDWGNITVCVCRGVECELLPTESTPSQSSTDLQGSQPNPRGQKSNQTSTDIPPSDVQDQAPPSNQTIEVCPLPKSFCSSPSAACSDCSMVRVRTHTIHAVQQKGIPLLQLTEQLYHVSGAATFRSCLEHMPKLLLLIQLVS